MRLARGSHREPLGSPLVAPSPGREALGPLGPVPSPSLLFPSTSLVPPVSQSPGLPRAPAGYLWGGWGGYAGAQ